MVKSIQRWGGYTRSYSHGNLKKNTNDVVYFACEGLLLLEPSSQGELEHGEEYKNETSALYSLA